MKTKLCSKCGVERRIDGTSQNGSYCKKCRALYQAAYAKRTNYKDAKRRNAKMRQFIQDTKSVPCADCGHSYPWYVMDFDHRGDKEFNLSVASNKGYGEQRVRDEMAKCEIVCANCHRIRTFTAVSSNGQDVGL